MPGPQCSLHMLWNTQIVDTCIVFPGWHISSTTAFIFSCLAVIGLSVFYEYLRVFQKKYDVHLAKTLVSQGRGKVRAAGSGRSTPDIEPEESGLLSGRRSLSAAATGTPVPPIARITRAIFYGATIFLSFFLMLVFMTYNAYLIASVVVGAGLGHYIFGSTINVDAVLSDSQSAKTMACH
ncbi:Ctr copper transporter [Collybia nuda]|uniref:Copper transport protein n=1 Tax=Collybia nuda TaxID=64659 RepID=A0A9P6CPA4_9AGAR|nr:Ctr copper transporter [Collybia nuda]